MDSKMRWAVEAAKKGEALRAHARGFYWCERWHCYLRLSVFHGLLLVEATTGLDLPAQLDGSFIIDWPHTRGGLHSSVEGTDVWVGNLMSPRLLTGQYARFVVNDAGNEVFNLDELSWLQRPTAAEIAPALRCDGSWCGLPCGGCGAAFEAACHPTCTRKGTPRACDCAPRPPKS